MLSTAVNFSIQMFPFSDNVQCWQIAMPSLSFVPSGCCKIFGLNPANAYKLPLISTMVATFPNNGKLSMLLADN